MKNILVFEKERIVCLDIKTIFSDRGFNVVFGQSVQDLAGQQVDPALVILDMQSYELFEKENLWSYLGYQSAKQVPLILCYSSEKNPLEETTNTEMHIIGTVKKPYDSIQLVEMYKKYQEEKAYKRSHRFALICTDKE